MGLLSVRRRLLILGLLGVVMTMAVAGAAITCLDHVSRINRELAQVNRALHFHQHGDMMHDALRADVARAQLVGPQHPRVPAAKVLRETQNHARLFRSDLRAVSSVHLPGPLRDAIDRLRPAQEIYISTSETMVESTLAAGGSAPAAEASYEAAFHQLVPSQAAVTTRLLATSARVERAATEEKNEAVNMIGLATTAALAGWLALILWHNRSIGSLQEALVREAEQRSAAELLQRSLLPTHLPTLPGVRFAARTVPGSSSQRIGGDWYDAFTLPSGQVCLVVGDVVGHDLPAAAVMGQLRNTLRAYAVQHGSPADVLTKVNQAAYLLGISEFATCICAVLDPRTMTVWWSSAGHLPPLVWSGDGTRRLLSGEPGPPLGVTPATEYPRHRVTLAPGESLLMYSDGLVERRGTPIDTGLAALQTVPISSGDPEEMCDQVLTGLLEDRSGRDDDVTLLLVNIEQQDAATDTGAPRGSDRPVHVATSGSQRGGASRRGALPRQRPGIARLRDLNANR